LLFKNKGAQKYNISHEIKVYGQKQQINYISKRK